MAAAASIPSLLHVLPTIHTTSSINNCSLLSFSTTNIFESKTRTLKTVTLKPLSSLLNSRLSSSSSFAAYAETDEDDSEDEEGEQEEEGGGEIGLAKSPAAEEMGRLYVGNLPYSVTSDQLAEIFSQAGTVETAEETKKAPISNVCELNRMRKCRCKYGRTQINKTKQMDINVYVVWPDHRACVQSAKS